MPTTLITGANRGIGLELAKQLAAAGHTVIATARNPNKADELKAALNPDSSVERLDVNDQASIDALADRLNPDGSPRPIDILINNAGVGSTKAPLAETDLDELLDVFSINAVGPLRVTRALLPNLHAGDRKLVLNVSSQLGSITNNTGGSSYAYRGSKAALNMLTKHLAIELAEHNFTVITCHPGWVQTDMGGPNATLTVPDSATALITNIINPAKPETHNATYRNYDGTELPW